VINISPKTIIVDFPELNVSTELRKKLLKFPPGENAFIVIREKHILGMNSLKKLMKGLIRG
jgi:hypothetical protein